VRQCLSPPSADQREKNIIPIDPVSLVDMFRAIAVRHKIPTYTHSERGRETYKPLKAHSEKEKEKEDFRAILLS
jgi:hypothetical protein